MQRLTNSISGGLDAELASDVGLYDVLTMDVDLTPAAPPTPPVGPVSTSGLEPAPSHQPIDIACASESGARQVHLPLSMPAAARAIEDESSKTIEDESSKTIDLDLEESLEQLINDSREEALSSLSTRSAAAGVTSGVVPSLDPGSGPVCPGPGTPGRGPAYRQRIGGGGRLVATSLAQLAAMLPAKKTPEEDMIMEAPGVSTPVAGTTSCEVSGSAIFSGAGESDIGVPAALVHVSRDAVVPSVAASGQLPGSTASSTTVCTVSPINFYSAVYQHIL